MYKTRLGVYHVRGFKYDKSFTVIIGLTYQFANITSQLNTVIINNFLCYTLITRFSVQHTSSLFTHRRTQRRDRGRFGREACARVAPDTGLLNELCKGMGKRFNISILIHKLKSKIQLKL